MTREFNTTGICIPGRRYMADMSKKLAEIMILVSRGDYFTINRPRQYGKTTIIHLLELRMKKQEDYLVINISFEGIGSESYKSEAKFI